MLRVSLLFHLRGLQQKKLQKEKEAEKRRADRDKVQPDDQRQAKTNPDDRKAKTNPDIRSSLKDKESILQTQFRPKTFLILFYPQIVDQVSYKSNLFNLIEC
jgi:uncharacterized Zn finger protein